ncbi:MAG TPA: hypothetical protein VEY07_04355 [Thermoplasmata archaeon]|nr:hypothetical protein [Thermoplasmata archaeon]
MEVPRMLVVAALTIRASFTGLRPIALAVLASIPTLIVVAVLAGRGSTDSAASAAFGLFGTLTLRVVLMLIVLVLLTSQFRSEIELDTLTYLTTRSIPRAQVAVGKYLGGVSASLALLLPAALAPAGVAALAGATMPSVATPEAIVVVTVFATLAYGAVFLLFGLLTRSALILGLIYGFLWEELLLFLPGQFPRLTVLYYLGALATRMAPTGPFSGPLPPISLAAAAAAPLLVAVVFVGLTAFLLRTIETAPQRVSA